MDLASRLVRTTEAPGGPDRAGAVAEATVDLAVQLVAMDTVNPGLVPGAAGEAAAVDLLRVRLEAAGFDCDVVLPPGRPDRPSLLAQRPGRRRSGRPAHSARSLLLNGHLDTVGPGGMPDPYGARIEGDRRTGRLLGRGACDMKGGVAAIVVAAETVSRSDPDADLILALVADEEDASAGTEAVIARLAALERRPDAALVTEPTWLDLAVAHRGFAVVEVELRGRASHSSRAADGVNAVAHLGRLLTAVEEYDARLRARTAHPLLGHGTLLATVARGGSAPFSIPDAASAVVERRTLPGEEAEVALAEVQRILERLHAEDPALDATARLRLGRAAYEMSDARAAAALASLLAEGLVRAGRQEPARTGAPYWMESALWQAAGIPTVVCGPAGGGLHADDEWLDLAQLRAFAVSLTQAAETFTAVLP
jgi:acetylornithine deacetylase